jgi:hypothetical protein
MQQKVKGDAARNDAGDGSAVLVGLADVLSAAAWLKRDLPKPRRLIGDLLTTTSRVFLVGSTGAGKTHLALAAAVAMATGAPFLHWSAAEPVRVLYIDGEMPASLMKERIAGAAGRVDHDLQQLLGGNLFFYARDWAEHLARRYPTLGELEPLNTEAGQNFIKRLVAIIRPDAIVFDNVMSLITGDQKDEVPWSETLSLVAYLTAQQIGQLWCDHTGWDTKRQYGSSTKAWRFDAVGIMTPVPNYGHDRHELAFTLSFDAPGKARRRTPANWEQFAPHVVRLSDDQWTAEPLERAERAKQTTKPSPMDLAFHNALVNALVITEKPGETTTEAWLSESVRLGLVDEITLDDDRKEKDRKRSKFRKHRANLVAAHWVACDGQRVTNLRRQNA